MNASSTPPAIAVDLHNIIIISYQVSTAAVLLLLLLLSPPSCFLSSEYVWKYLKRPDGKDRQSSNHDKNYPGHIDVKIRIS